MFVDDTELYKSDSPSEAFTLAWTIECISDLKFWVVQNKLQLNDDRTESSHRLWSWSKLICFLHYMSVRLRVISVIRSWKTQICNSRTIKICYWNCFEIKAWTLGRCTLSISSGNTFVLKDNPNLRILLSVVCNSDYCNQVTLRKRVHTNDPNLAELLWSKFLGAYCKMEWKHDMLHTCMSLSEHFKVHM